MAHRTFWNSVRTDPVPVASRFFLSMSGPCDFAGARFRFEAAPRTKPRSIWGGRYDSLNYISISSCSLATETHNAHTMRHIPMGTHPPPPLLFDL